MNLFTKKHSIGALLKNALILWLFVGSTVSITAQKTSPASSFVAGVSYPNNVKSFTLSGLEHSAVNGIYTTNGLNYLNQPRYTHRSGKYHIDYDGNGNWWINTDKGISGGSKFYRAAGGNQEPPLSGWLNDAGNAATLLLTADPKNAGISNSPKPIIAYKSRIGTDDIDPNQVITPVQVKANKAINNSRIEGNSTLLNAKNSNIYYIYNLRIGYYKINDDNGNCDFSGEDPDPRYAVSTSGSLSFSQTINPGDDKNCGWQRMDNDGRFMTSGAILSTSGSSPYSFSMNVSSWEEDGCGDDNTYDDNCFSNDDDHPASTNTTITLDPNYMTLGYNFMDVTWSGNGAQYGLTLEWELEISPTPLVTLYSDANQSGRTQKFGIGTYNVNSLFTGVGNDNVSAMDITGGYKVVAYNNSGLVGYPMDFSGTVNSVGGLNDKMSSFEVTAATAPQTNKTLLIYFNGSGKSIGYQLQRFATKVDADQMIFIKGVGGDDSTYVGYNENGLQYNEHEVINEYDGFDAGNPFPTTFYSTANVFKNYNNGGGTYRYFFGVDMEYDGGVAGGYEDEDSYTAAANVLRVLRRYNLSGYSKIVISGHSRGSAVGITSFLHGIQKAVQGDPQFSEFQVLVNDVFSSASVINVVALDPVAGSQTIGLTNDYHMGSSFRMREIYQWLRAQYTNINFSEIYANGGRMLEADELGGIGGLLPGSTFDPSPNYLHVEPTNQVQRYWLGYRHSSMVNKGEKWSFLYDYAGIERPWLLTADMLDAALSDQTLFRNYTYWHSKFRTSDQLAWQQALYLYGCDNTATLTDPDGDLEFQHYHGTRHTNFDNSDASSVNMNSFVGDNDIKLYCSEDSKTPENAGSSYTAANSNTDANGWTHYCSCQGERLLSVNLGTSGAVIPDGNVSLNPIPSYFFNGGMGFINNPSGAAVLGRTWSASSNTALSSPIGVRFYFKQTDMNAINTLLGNGLTIDKTELSFYETTSGTEHFGVGNISSANVLFNSATASTLTWRLDSTVRGDYYAEYEADQLLRGGGYALRACPANTTLFVDASVATSGDGTSWMDAYKTLDEALAISRTCTDVTTINVAAGTYKPSTKPYNNGAVLVNSDNRTVAFHVRPNLSLLGGFPVGGGMRNPANNTTILSGDIGTVNSNSDNAHHVVLITGSGDVTIDGFTIQHGNATTDGTTSTIPIDGHNVFVYTGGGLYIYTCNTTLRNNIFVNNIGSFTGGAIRYDGGTHSAVNNLFYNNSSNNYASVIGTNGGATYALYNNTFANNTTGQVGTAIYNFNSSCTLKNNIFWNNSKNGTSNLTQSEIINDGGILNPVENCLLQPNSNLMGLNNIVGQDPLFTNAANGDFTLQNSSPALNAGDDATWLATSLITDIAGNLRPYGVVDMGAYESQALLPVEMLFFTGEAIESGNLLTWATASEENNAGFEVQKSTDGRFFEKIAFVEGNGTTYELHNYEWLDEKVSNNTAYYRLKQTDFNGKFEYSKIVNISNGNVTEKVILLYPNPVQDALIIENGEGTAIIYNALGQPLQQFKITDSKHVLNTSDLPKGIYTLQIRKTDGTAVVKQFIK